MPSTAMSVPNTNVANWPRRVMQCNPTVIILLFIVRLDYVISLPPKPPRHVRIVRTVQGYSDNNFSESILVCSLTANEKRLVIIIRITNIHLRFYTGTQVDIVVS